MQEVHTYLRNSLYNNGLEPIGVTCFRRSFLKWCGTVGLTAIGLAAYRTDEASRIPVTEEFDVFHPSLRGIISPITIVQVTDLHFGFFFGTDELARLVTNLNTIEADALVLTGDIFHSARTSVEAAMPIFKELVSRRWGNYAVTGNYEYYAGEKHCVRVLDESGLRNTQR